MTATTGVKRQIVIQLDGREPIALASFEIPITLMITPDSHNPMQVSLMASFSHLGLTRDLAAVLHQAADTLATDALAK